MNYSENDYYADQNDVKFFDRNDPESYERAQQAKSRLAQYGKAFQQINQTMSYNRNYQSNSMSYSNNNNGFAKAPYRQNNNRSFNNNSNFQQQQQAPKKHSGCESGLDKNGNPYVRGWKYDKTNGLRSFFAAPYHGTKKSVSKSGKEWHNWIVKITPSGGQSFITTGLYDVQTKRVIISELSFIMNPKGGKGGYTGPLFTRK